MELLDPTLQNLLEDLAEQLGHGLTVDSVDGRLIAYSTQDAHADPARIASILSRRVTPEIQQWQNRHGIARATAPVRVPANAELGMRARVCVPIRHGQRCLGYLWIPHGDQALDGAALEAATDASSALARCLAGRAGEREELIRRLLDRDRPGEAARDRLAGLDPSLLGAEIVVCAAVPIGRARVPGLSATEFGRLGTELPRALRADPTYAGGFVTATHVITLARHGGPDGAPRHPAVLDRALRGAARRPFAIGVSDPARFQVEPVRHAYGQARAAADAAVRDPALPRILPWSGAGPYRMLLGEPPLAPDPVLVPLERAGDSAQLLRTLETYLDLGCDVQRTAASLHLHRTTVYYRLGRIAAVLGADLRDGLVRTHLHLALKARRLAAGGVDLAASRSPTRQGS
ncbi:PucR family transcriptional regulator [Nonomuraea zeae]|uniref:PucR family transcriptional regulator n=1 Tax=Nonomuraea zeae TaxID=1642303 RepID=A0A5S4FNL4_9ACTN|nr:helix-turn-helix domain-containing protein [Nonomuraea zeae]TMR22265.1 PucR family transcriptional regulator [Nonomuraea zeae]